MDNSAKILLLGKTGVGKSSFINYFLGKNVAEAGAGKPVTTEYFIPHEVEGGRYPILIFDTKGLEAKGAYNQLDKIIQGIKQRNNSDDILNWFHTIFYVVSMTNPRFEDFEAMFISTLQKELSQHIHIIITHCDACKPENIANMRRTITEKLGNMENVEIFEVVCVSMKKRNGQVAEPYGREVISERVFDLLLKDVAYKLSFDYAHTLWNTWRQLVDDVFAEMDSFVDETVKFGTLLKFIKDDTQASENIDRRMEETFSKLDENIETIQRQTDERFNKILYPVAQLYASYRDTVTDSYVEGAELAFSDTFNWLDTNWMDELDDAALFEKVLPRMRKYMDENGEFSDGDNDSIGELFSMIGAGIGDLFSLKKNIKKALQEMKWELMYQSIPSQDEIQSKAFEQIVAFIKPDEPSASEALKNLKAAFGGLREGMDELTEGMAMLCQTAEANNGKIPDVNEIMRQILEEDQN